VLFRSADPGRDTAVFPLLPPHPTGYGILWSGTGLDCGGQPATGQIPTIPDAHVSVEREFQSVPAYDLPYIHTLVVVGQRHCLALALPAAELAGCRIVLVVCPALLGTIRGHIGHPGLRLHALGDFPFVSDLAQYPSATICHAMGHRLRVGFRRKKARLVEAGLGRGMAGACDYKSFTHLYFSLYLLNRKDGMVLSLLKIVSQLVQENLIIQIVYPQRDKLHPSIGLTRTGL